MGEALQQGIVVLDANVLLDLYKYHEEFTNTWIKLFEKLGMRLFIPHQAFLEFWKHRPTLAAYNSSVLETQSKLERLSKDFSRLFAAWVRDRGRQLADHQRNHLYAITEASQALVDDLEAAKQDHAQRFSSDPTRDEIVKHLDRVVQQGAVVGADFTSTAEREAAEKAGDTRFKAKIPPGYEDDGTDPNSRIPKQGTAKYGDYLLWRQSLEYAREELTSMKLPSDQRFLVLVTRDSKDDWWQDYVNGPNSDKVRIPRHELVTEVRRETGARYIQLSPAEFLKHAGRALEVAVSEDAVAATSAITKVEWLEAEFTISIHNSVVASAQVSPTGQTRVLADSRAKSKETESIAETYKNLRKKLIDSGVLAESPDPNFYVFTEDYDFNSPSSASSVVLGAQTSGNAKWISRWGTIPETRSALTGDDGLEDEDFE